MRRARLLGQARLYGVIRYEQSPLGTVSTNECWLNVGPVLVSIGPAPSQNRVVKEAFCCSDWSQDRTWMLISVYCWAGYLADMMHSSAGAGVSVTVGGRGLTEWTHWEFGTEERGAAWWCVPSLYRLYLLVLHDHEHVHPSIQPFISCIFNCL